MNQHFPTVRRLLDTSFPYVSFWPRRTTTSQRRSLLRLIATATEERIPLVPLLQAHIEDERGAQRGRLRRLVRLLENGTSLADAIEQVPSVVTDEDALTIRFGAQSGILAPAVRASLDQPDLLSAQAASEGRKSLTYLLVMLVIAGFIITFQQLKIIPKLMQIVDDFGVEPSMPLAASEQFGEFAARWGWIAFVLALVVLWCLFSTRAGRVFRRAVAGRFSRSLRDWRAAEVLQRLGWAAQAGRPLPGALSTLARYHFDQTIRHKLLDVRNEVEQGANLWQSMAKVHLLTQPEVAVIETASRMKNRDWTLNQLALTRKQRIVRRIDALSNLFAPFMVFVVAVFVFLQAIAVFVSLSHFIYNF